MSAVDFGTLPEWLYFAITAGLLVVGWRTLTSERERNRSIIDYGDAKRINAWIEGFERVGPPGSRVPSKWLMVVSNGSPDPVYIWEAVTWWRDEPNA